VLGWTAPSPRQCASRFWWYHRGPMEHVHARVAHCSHPVDDDDDGDVIVDGDDDGEVCPCV
jgi:hypothetical protein